MMFLILIVFILDVFAVAIINILRERNIDIILNKNYSSNIII